jgi:hypothetical protein
MKNALALKAAGVIFLFVAIMHLLRVIFKVDVTVGSFVVPAWLSIFGFAVATLLSLWMFKSAK